MAADLSIHVFEGITEDDLRRFFSNTLGSKYFNPVTGNSDLDLYTKIGDTPSCWIGEVSWLKAALFDDAETYVPDPVAEVSDLIGEDLPVLDDDLRDKILLALDSKNKTGYSTAHMNDVREFLGKHMGKRLFTVSW